MSGLMSTMPGAGREVAAPKESSFFIRLRLMTIQGEICEECKMSLVAVCRGVVCTEVFRGWWDDRKYKLPWPRRRALSPCCEYDQCNHPKMKSPKVCKLRDENGNCEGGTLCLVGGWRFDKSRVKFGDEYVTKIKQLGFPRWSLDNPKKLLWLRLVQRDYRGGNCINDKGFEELPASTGCRGHSPVTVYRIDIHLDIRKLVLCQCKSNGKHCLLVDGKAKRLCQVVKYGKLKHFRFRGMTGDPEGPYTLKVLLFILLLHQSVLTDSCLL